MANSLKPLVLVVGNKVWEVPAETVRKMVAKSKRARTYMSKEDHIKMLKEQGKFKEKN